MKRYEASMRYSLPYMWLSTDDLAKIAKTTTNMSVGWKLVKREHPAVKIGVTLPARSYPLYYSVWFKTEGKKQLEDAVTDFVDIAGAPNYVSGGYDLVSRILKPYGKKIRKSLFARAFWGMQAVVDA